MKPPKAGAPGRRIVLGSGLPDSGSGVHESRQSRRPQIPRTCGTLRIHLAGVLRDSGGMSDKELREQLAGVVVEALELGSRKEDATVGDLFAAFAIEVPELPHGAPRGDRKGIVRLRRSAAAALADAAPSAGALLSEVIRYGGRFVAMVDDVYRRLARHAATTTGTSEVFSVQRDEVDTGSLTLSPAFLQQVRALERRLREYDVGRIDAEALANFVRWDNGECFGTWPLGARSGVRLPDAVLLLPWLREAAGERGPGADTVTQAVDGALAAAAPLMEAAERLVGAHMASTLR